MKEDMLKKITGIVWVMVIMTGIVGATTISDTNSDFTGNIAVSGTVDGRDLAADGTKTDSLWTYLSGINQKVASTSNVTFNKAILAPAQAQVGLVIDQNNAAQGLNIDSEAPNSNGIYIDMLDAGTSGAIYVQRDSNEYVDLIRSRSVSTGSNLFYRDLDAASTGGPVVKIDNNNAGDDQSGLLIENSASSNTLYLLRSGNDYATLLRDSLSTSGSNFFYRNLDAASTGGPVFKIVQNNAGDDQDALFLNNEGTGYGMRIDQNSNQYGLYLDSEATTASGIGLDMLDAGTGSGIYAQRSTNDITDLLRNPLSTGGSNYFYRNLDAASTAGPIITIFQDHASDDQPALSVRNDGDRAQITLTPKATAPTSCIIGDVYTDTSGAYCWCGAINTWENLASTGTCV